MAGERVVHRRGLAPAAVLAVRHGTPQRVVGGVDVVEPRLLAAQRGGHDRGNGGAERDAVRRLRARGGDLEHVRRPAVAVEDRAEQVDVLDSERGLRGDGPREALVLLGEDADALVDDLQGAEHAAILVAHRCAQDGARAVARTHVDVAVEPLVLVGVLDVGELVVRHGPADDAGAPRDPDLRHLLALGDLRPQLVAVLVDQEQRGALRVRQQARRVHEALEELVHPALELVELARGEVAAEMCERARRSLVGEPVLLVQDVRLAQSAGDDVHEGARHRRNALEAVGQIVVARAQQLAALEASHRCRAHAVGEVAHLADGLAGEDPRERDLLPRLIDAVHLERAGGEDVEAGVLVILGDELLGSLDGHLLEHRGEVLELGTRERGEQRARGEAVHALRLDRAQELVQADGADLEQQLAEPPRRLAVRLRLDGERRLDGDGIALDVLAEPPRGGPHLRIVRHTDSPAAAGQGAPPHRVTSVESRERGRDSTRSHSGDPG